MNKEPLVSVIIPTYNRTEYLKYALDSVINQTYKNIEIIVSDDAGNPENYLIATSFNDSRVKYYRNKVNLGIAGNNIEALRKVNGKYIADLNDDDYWENNFLSKLIPYLENNADIVVAFSDHYIMNELNEIDFEATELNSKFWKRNNLTKGIYKPFYDIALVHRSVSIVMSAVIRKSAIDWDDFPLEVGCVYDFWLNYLACRSGKAAFYLPEKLTRYRVHADSESSQGRLRVNKGQIFCYSQFLKDDNLSQYFSEFKKSLAYAYRNAGSATLQDCNFSEAQKLFLDAIKTRITVESTFLLFLSFLPCFVIQNIIKIVHNIKSAR